jgi:hypothetical protein
MPLSFDKPLSKSTVQEIQLELLRRAGGDGYNAEVIIASLLQHKDLWESAMLDRFCFSNPGRLPSIGLIKLRDLADDFWNADTLYILTPNVEAAKKLSKIIKRAEWGGMMQLHTDQKDIDSALGSGREERAVISIWWD